MKRVQFIMIFWAMVYTIILALVAFFGFPFNGTTGFVYGCFLGALDVIFWMFAWAWND
jgi:hypothetical protein